MPRWKTDEIIAAISALGCSVEKQPQGGDYDTTTIVATAHGAEADNFLHIAGFNPEHEITTPDDVEVEMVELSDGQDSRGGLNTDDAPTEELYLKIKRMLRKMGFQVVNQMKDYL